MAEIQKGYRKERVSITGSTPQPPRDQDHRARQRRHQQRVEDHPRPEVTACELQEAQISETREREPVLAVLLPEPSDQARLVPCERRDEEPVLSPWDGWTVLRDADQHHQQHRRPDDPDQRADTPRRTRRGHY